MEDLHNLKAYTYSLPSELIAQFPSKGRGESRLMVIDRAKQTINIKPFNQITQHLAAGDRLVFNNTKVIPARLFGKKKSGAHIELLLTKQLSPFVWRTMMKPAKKMGVGETVHFASGAFGQVSKVHDDGERTVEFGSIEGDFFSFLDKEGQLPLPPYIKRKVDQAIDPNRYQTVYAQKPGALAAPTAGLHFSKDLLVQLEEQGIGRDFLTLHVGVGTFKPVIVDDIRDHKMHKEEVHISEEAAISLNSDCRHICVGTTCCRSLESAANSKGEIIPGVFETDAFIYPGYQFKYMESLLTNFHLPGSTLLMLTCAFGGYDLIMEAYQMAVKERLRFFSYGDAMLIL